MAKEGKTLADLRAVLGDFLNRVWTEGDESAIYEMMSDTVSVEGLEETRLESAASCAAFRRMMAAQFDDISVTLERSVTEGEWIAAYGFIRARERRSGRAIEGRLQMMYHIVDGIIIEGHNLVDFITVFQQAGALPERTLDMCLLGQPPKFLEAAHGRIVKAV